MSEIKGHGIDLVECGRIKELADRYGDRFLHRVFTPAELTYSGARKRRWEHLAGRFAVKEAVLKALGTGWRGEIAWTDIEVNNDPLGRPAVQLSGFTQQLAQQKGITEIQVSISHNPLYAIASALAIGPV